MDDAGRGNYTKDRNHAERPENYDCYTCEDRLIVIGIRNVIIAV